MIDILIGLLMAGILSLYYLSDAAGPASLTNRRIGGNRIETITFGGVEAEAFSVNWWRVIET